MRTRTTWNTIKWAVQDKVIQTVFITALIVGHLASDWRVGVATALVLMALDTIIDDAVKGVIEVQRAE